jgi:hypothetical protein
MVDGLNGQCGPFVLQLVAVGDKNDIENAQILPQVTVVPCVSGTRVITKTVTHKNVQVTIRSSLIYGF